jgi:hypothetical protein
LSTRRRRSETIRNNPARLAYADRTPEPGQERQGLKAR